MYRKEVIKKLVAEGVPTRVYGHNWDRHTPWPGTDGNLRKTLHDMWFYLLPRAREEGWGRVWDVLRRRLAGDRRPAVSDNEFPAAVVQGEYSEADFTALVRGAGINLGFTHMNPDWTREYPRQVRLRDFEIPMHGGFYLAQDCPELARHFEIGKEIVVWDTADDLVEKCRHYLERPGERAAVAEAGCRRARGWHTWVSRFAGLAKHLGMRLPSSAV